MSPALPPGDHVGRHRRAGGATGALVAAAVLARIAVGAALAASPSPAASPEPVNESNIEAWLDVPIPPSAAVGQPFGVGVTLWDRSQGTFSEITDLFVRLHPATGKAKPTEGKATSDWPGHIIAEVVIPSGGPGSLDVGIHTQVCTPGGGCKPGDFLIPFAGVGPPPNASRAELIVATVSEPHDPVTAGAPFDLVVLVEAQAAWDLSTLGLPDRLIAIVNERSGPDLATAELHISRDRGSGSGVTFSGQITIPEPGELTLVVAIPGNGGADQVIRGSATRLTVGGEAVAGSARPGAPGTSPVAAEDGPPWQLVGAAVLALAGGFVIRKVFADL
jgi:hypothetical protein